MTGRDIVKFIVVNNLLDKNCISESADDVVIRFLDYLSNDDAVRYVLNSEGRIRVSLSDPSNTYLLKNSYVDDYNINGLKQLDSSVPDDAFPEYNTYSNTFVSWMKSLVDEDSITHRIVEYASIDTNFVKYCTTYNRMMSYLEGKEVDSTIIKSAEISWTQYMRECREVE